MLNPKIFISTRPYHAFFTQNPPPKTRHASTRTEMSLGCLVGQNIFHIPVDDFPKTRPPLSVDSAGGRSSVALVTCFLGV
jgi:hypothetical protein